MPRTDRASTGWPLLDAAARQGRIIHALLMREMHTRYGRENLGFVWFIAEPLLFSVGVIALWSALHGRYEHGLPILAFTITGYLPLTLWRHVTARAIHCFRANAPLLYHRQVRMLDLLLARVVLEVYGVMAAYLVIAFVFMTAGLYEPPKDWALFYAGWFYFVALTTGFGLIVGSLTEMYDWAEKLIGPLMYFLLPICGFFYMADWLPENLRHYALLMPTVDAYEMIRGGQFGNTVRVHYDIAYLTYVSVAMIGVGLILTRRVHSYLVIE